ncbi:MAG: multidrug transporter [Legionellales bacterium RIFCSPHIGHO2_12_FULL_42_9]|nr:MAG: multidrug transporter [Legionellales bacterium RIFCSPHIGHO2_12_FULL_42_9]
MPIISISRRRALKFAAFLVLYEFLTYIANDMIMPGMIKVIHAFHAPESAIASSLTAYLLGGSSLQLILGPLSDHYGRRPVMLIGSGLFFCCTIAIAMSNNINQFLIARFFQGMGLCFIGTIGYATIQEIFSEMDAVRLIAVMTSVAIIAPLIGPLLGAILIYYTNWRIIYVLISIFAIIAFWGLKYFMPETVTDKLTLSCKTVLYNYRDLLTNITFMSGSMAVAVLTIPCLAWIALAPVILIKVAKLSVISYGIWQIPIFGAAIIGAWILRHMTTKLSLPTIIIIGAACSTISLIITGLIPWWFASTNYIGLLPGLILYFLSMSIIATPLNRLIIFATSVGKGTSSALLSMILMLIQAAGIEIANVIYVSHNNIIFGMYCLLAGILFICILPWTKTQTNARIT